MPIPIFSTGYREVILASSDPVLAQAPTQEPAPAVRRLRGVIFDMDGVLVRSEPLLAEAAIRMFAEKGYTVAHDEFRPFIGMGEDRFLGGVAEARGIPLDVARDKSRTYALYLDLI